MALLITAGYLLVEVVGGLLTGSLALLADAGHMLTDVAALALALFAFWLARRPSSPRRTYGWYRAEVLAALANGVLLVLITLAVVWEALQRLAAPPEVAALPMLAVAGLGLLANLASAWILHGGEGLNQRGAYLHVLGDLLGSAGALAAGLVILTTGWGYADPLASLGISVLVLWSAWRLVIEAVDVLLEASPRDLDMREVAAALRQIPGVSDVHDLHGWTVTSGFTALSGHLALEAGQDPAPVLAAAQELLRRHFGVAHSTLQLEPAPLNGDEPPCISLECGSAETSPTRTRPTPPA